MNAPNHPHPPTHDGSAADPFRHPALFYRTRAEYLAGTVPFLQDGLAAGEPVAAAVPEPNLELLRAELGAAAEQITLLDMGQVGRNPGRIIPGVLRAFADAHPGRRVRIIGEPIWPGRSHTEYPACLQHEALINHAFTGRRATILCPYDAEALDPQILADAAATHPVLADADGARASDRYAADEIVHATNQPLPDVPGAQITELDYDSASLDTVRDLVTQHARRAGLPAERILDAELAVNELTANTLMHGGGHGTLRIWTEPRHLVCQTTDQGHIADPLTGRRPVPPDSPGGRGLLLVNQLADLTRTHTRPGATTTRIYFQR
ncbi:sensor histidine kinase [Actinomadura sp. KC216]|uniref:sensor histidine kinase n=1 Tax=Actinomadura sp. KC216 TaxID=2530370 RepID=UPI0010429FE4|nr:sensor histidine kinase [Actinomadura sp. KC216]TDB84639.1 sensor histidine kinase [Actinomadura sp. KC216]